VGPILLRQGCSIGACAVVLPGVTIGRFAMVGAGAVVTRGVPDHGLVVGNPARLVGFVCACGGRLSFDGLPAEGVVVQQRTNGIEVLPHGYRHGHCAACGMATVLAEGAGPEQADGSA
jgi:tetrahydrodipicolinate N-succinyltransferase